MKTQSPSLPRTAIFKEGVGPSWALRISSSGPDAAHGLRCSAAGRTCKNISHPPPAKPSKPAKLSPERAPQFLNRLGSDEAVEPPLPALANRRRGKGEKANKKKMAAVGAVYTIEPFVRTTDEVIDEVMRKNAAKRRPLPAHKRVRAELLVGKVALFLWLADESVSGAYRLFCAPRFRSFRTGTGAHLPTLPNFVAPFGRRWQRSLEMVAAIPVDPRGLKGSRKKTVRDAAEYFERNRARMKYDEYLAAGYPIGSGVVEGACRHLVKDRMERTGMRWVPSGAQAMLDLRGTYLNGEWNDFWEYHVEQEDQRLYSKLRKAG